MKQLKLAVLVCAGFLAMQAFADTGPIVDSVFGSGTVTVKSRAGASATAEEGQALKVGDVVTTDGSSAARLVYSDNSQLYVGRNSRISVNARRGGADVTSVEQGKARAKVAKADTSGDEAASKKKTKFLIRTKSAVMGVRGTDFVTDTGPDGNIAEVHTLEGEVIAAKPGDENGLFSGKGLMLRENQFFQTKLGGALGLARAFKREEFLQKLNAAQPEFKNLMERMPKGYDQLQKLRTGLPNQLGTGSLTRPQPVSPKMPRIPTIPPIRR